MTWRHLRVAGVLATLGLASSLAAGPGSVGAAAGTSPVVFSTCGSFSWTVPDGVTSLTADVFGAAGGSGSVQTGGTAAAGGLGGEALGSFTVTPGEVLQINVGCKGTDASGSTPGSGGPGGNNDADGGHGSEAQALGPFTASGGGGGASDIRQGGVALGNRVIVAGAGGASSDALTGKTASTGGGGGFPTGQAGGGTGSPGSNCMGGSGGTQIGGGAGGATSTNCNTAGTTATGPNGANSVTGGFAPGAGGGGFNGGGSGANQICGSTTAGGGGGGGGASFFAVNVTSRFSADGVHAGDGRVVLSFSAAIPVIASFTC